MINSPNLTFPKPFLKNSMKESIADTVKNLNTGKDINHIAHPNGCSPETMESLIFQLTLPTTGKKPSTEIVHFKQHDSFESKSLMLEQAITRKEELMVKYPDMQGFVLVDESDADIYDIIREVTPSLNNSSLVICFQDYRNYKALLAHIRKNY